MGTLSQPSATVAPTTIDEEDYGTTQESWSSEDMIFGDSMEIELGMLDPYPTSDRPAGIVSPPAADPIGGVDPHPPDKLFDIPLPIHPVEVAEVILMKSERIVGCMWRQCLVPYQLVPDAPEIGCVRFVSTFLLCIVPTAVAIYIFSAFGEGFRFLQWSQQYSALLPAVWWALIATLAGMYLLDAERWSKTLRGRILFNCSVGLALLLILTLALVSAKVYPYGSLFLFVGAFPLYLFAIKFFFYPLEKTRAYFSSLSGPLFLVFLVVTTAFAVWVFYMDHPWSHTTRLEYFLRSECKADFYLHPQCRGMGNGSCLELSGDKILFTTDSCSRSCEAVYDSCHHPYVLWAWPLMASTAIFFLSFVCAFVNGGYSNSDGARAPMLFLRVWSVLFFLVWVVASLSGSAYGEGVINFIMAMFLAVGMIAAITFGRPKYARVLAQRAEEGLGTNVDMAKAVLVVTCTPIFVVYLGASVLNQRVRIIRRALRDGLCPMKSVPDEGDESVDTSSSAAPDGWLTVNASQHLKTAREWDLSKITVWAVYFGILFMIGLVFIAQFTTVLLSFVIGATATMNLALVTVCMIVVGLMMFLLPPVPGLPVYVAAGVVLVPPAKDEFGLFFAAVYACGICLFMKLMACALQQKVIGEGMSHLVSVRQAVQINSDFMRTFKLLLSDKGVSPQKVALLCGGPDWPTSVNCGIMRLPVLPIMLGTLPIIVLIVPTVLTGTFMYLSQLPPDEDGTETYWWADTASIVSLALSSGVQFVTFLYAASYIEKAMSERKEDLDRIPIDEEVQNADERDKVNNEAYLKVIQWGTLPVLAKIVLVLALFSMICSCYLVQFFGERCFRIYKLTYTIQDHLDGNVLNLVKREGWISLTMFLLSCILISLFTIWAKKKAANTLSSD